jgi:hypothetical protein
VTHVREIDGEWTPTGHTVHKALDSPGDNSVYSSGAIQEVASNLNRAEIAPHAVDAPAPEIDAGVRSEPPEAALEPLADELQRIADGTKRVGDTVADVGPTPEVKPIADAFTSGMSPAQRTRAESALATKMSHNGAVVSRKELVDSLIEDGATVISHPKDGSRLMRPDGAYIEQSRLTKTAMDYARFRSRAVEPPPTTTLDSDAALLEPEPVANEVAPTPPQRIHTETRGRAGLSASSPALKAAA